MFVCMYMISSRGPSCLCVFREHTRSTLRDARRVNYADVTDAWRVNVRPSSANNIIKYEHKHVSLPASLP